MIKVFSFAGSCAGEKSTTARFSDSLAEVFKKKAAEIGEEVKYKRVTGDMLNIKFCRSCVSCFKKGVCPLDAHDDMPKLKQDFLDSDIIFFGTPVYLWEMSGIAKCVLDRISYWAHRYELAGKLGVVFAVTDTSKAKETSENLGELLSFMGLTIVKCSYAFNAANNPNLYLDEEIMPEYEEISNLLLEARKNPEKFIMPLQERAFISRKFINLRAEAMNKLADVPLWAEAEVCRDRGVNNYKSYREFIIDVFKNGLKNDVQ